MCAFNQRLYNIFMAPLEEGRLKMKRQQTLEEVAGDVLEIGFGTGANLPFYPYEQMDSLTLTDVHMPTQINLRPEHKHLPVTFEQCDAMSLPFEDKTFDSVVFTLVFCSVEDPMAGLAELHRVLKPGGRLFFIEHVHPTKEPYKKLFSRLNPTWRKFAHGCNLNRETMTYIQQSGFSLVEYHRFYRTAFISGSAEKL